jgi:hypothetical protein
MEHIEGLSIEKKAVREICRIKLKLGNDSAVRRVFVNPAKAVKAVNIQARDETAETGLRVGEWLDHTRGNGGRR